MDERTLDAIQSLDPRFTAKSATSNQNWLLQLEEVEVQSNLIRPRYSVVVHVSPTQGEQELLDQTLEAIAICREFSVVFGARRLSRDRKYERMQILIGGIGI